MAIVDGEIKDQEIVGGTLKRLLDRLQVKPKGRRTAISLGGSSVLIKRAMMPAKGADDMSEQVFYEAQQLFQHDMDDMYFRYQVLPTKNPKAEKVPVLLVGAKRDVVDGYLSMLHSIQMKAGVIDCDVLCVANMFDFNYPVDDAMVAAVNVGAFATQVVLTCGGEFLYTREFFLGGNEYTQKIADTLGIEMESAEALKVDVSLGNQSGTAELQKVLNEVNEALVSEIKTTLNFFFENESPPQGVRNVNYIFLTGGGARSLGLDATIAASLQVPVQIVNPFQRIDVKSAGSEIESLLAQGPLYGIALGLALRKFGDT
jgi:type IV pilus assembly protein PilM